MREKKRKLREREKKRKFERERDEGETLFVLNGLGVFQKFLFCVSLSFQKFFFFFFSKHKPFFFKKYVLFFCFHHSSSSSFETFFCSSLVFVPLGFHTNVFWPLYHTLQTPQK